MLVLALANTLAEAAYRATGKQLDRTALKASLSGAMELSKIYGDLSNTHHTDNTDLKELQQLIDKIKAWEQGSNTDKSNSEIGRAHV